MSARTVVGFLVALFSASTFAAHPLQTEDTGTQGSGNVEWENGFSKSRSAKSRLYVYQPQFSYGLTTPVDLIVQPSWLDSRDEVGARLRGMGDTNLDAKWRFFESDPWSLAVRAGVALPTARRGLGLPHGDTSEHALVALTFDAAPITFHANVGLTENPSNSGSRRRIDVVSAASMWAVTARLTLTVDGDVASDPDPSHSGRASSLLAGVIYSTRPGLDLDMGWQHSMSSGLSVRQWLAGITFRFAP